MIKGESIDSIAEVLTKVNRLMSADSLDQTFMAIENEMEGLNLNLEQANESLEMLDEPIDEDEYNKHRLYYTSTKDFNSFTDTKLLMDPGFSVIDAVIVKRDKDDYVLVLKDNTRPERRVHLNLRKILPFALLI